MRCACLLVTGEAVLEQGERGDLAGAVFGSAAGASVLGTSLEKDWRPEGGRKDGLSQLACRPATCLTLPVLWK